MANLDKILTKAEQTSIEDNVNFVSKLSVGYRYTTCEYDREKLWSERQEVYQLLKEIYHDYLDDGDNPIYDELEQVLKQAGVI